MKMIKKLFHNIWIHEYNSCFTDGKPDYEKALNYHKYMLIILLLAPVIAGSISIIFGLFFDKFFLHSEILDREYKNNHKYYNVRKLEYIGGINAIDSSVNMLKRWYPLYIDVDTKEILRGANTENYITCGKPKVGIDKIDILDERNTREGFQKYILNYIGAIEYTEKTIELPDKTFGVSKAIQDFNKPIDIIVDKNWNINREYRNNDIYLISTVSEVKNYALSGIVLEASGKFTENEYIFNILRNCFGYISDDFYDLLQGKNNFSEIYIHEVKMGDIGTFNDKDGNICVGICVGYDRKQNPIFVICSSYSKVKIKDLKDYNNFLVGRNAINKNKEKGFNVLVIEKKHIIPIFGKQHVFKHYYHTNLPFVDKGFIAKAYENVQYKIDDINKYNKQIYYEYSKIYKGTEDLSNRVYKERINRIIHRENEAKKIRKKYNINLLEYNDIDIQTFVNIYNVSTEQYKTRNYTIEDKEKYIESETEIRKQQDEYYKQEIDKFRKRIMSKKDQIKGKTIEEARKLFETNKTFLNDVGLEILGECLEIIDNE